MVENRLRRVAAPTPTRAPTPICVQRPRGRNLEVRQPARAIVPSLSGTLADRAQQPARTLPLPLLDMVRSAFRRRMCINRPPVERHRVPCSEQKIAQFRYLLMDYVLCTHFVDFGTKYFK